MPRKYLNVVFLLVLLLASCSPATIQVSRGPATSTPLPTQTLKPTSPPNISNCTVVSSVPATPDPTEAASSSIFKPVSDADYTKGPADAAVTIIVYSDLQCSSCAGFESVLNQLSMDFPQDVRVVFRYYPNRIHDKAMLSAQAAEAAGMQGKFWEMANQLFSQQGTWGVMSAADFETWVIGQASILKLDPERFISDMKSDAVVNKLKAILAEDETLSIPSLPFVLVNGTIWQGPRYYDGLATVINLELLKNKQVTGCPPMVIDVTKQYLAHLTTDRGEVVIQLYPDKAPFTVNSFIFLAKRGWFDGVTFHLVIPGLYAQSGDPSGTGYGSPGYAFANEISPDLKFDKPGVVGMANVGANSNSSQFFITFAAQPSMNGKYTIFGQVILGMDVVQKLTPRDTSKPGSLAPGDKIIKVTIEEK